MPSNQKQIATHTFGEAIDTTTDLTLIPNNRARYILNCLILSTGVGNVGIVTNLKGNVSIQTPLPSGENKTIGTAVDEEKNLFYFFVWNSEGYHTIFQFNELTKKVIVVIQSITDTNGVDVLNFSKDYLILMTDIIENNLLYWVDGLNDARKINIKKALDKSVTGYGINILEEYINAYKLAPSAAPIATYFSDVTKPFNRLYGASRKFASIFGYDDRERSVYSDFSNVVNPIKESFTGVINIPTDNNGIEIVVQTGSAIVKTIEIAMYEPKEDLPVPSWVTIVVLDKKKLNIPDNSTYVYKFYNEGGSYPTIADELIAKPQSYLPKAPLCQSKPRNSMAYANFNEGFEDVAINTSLTVAYEDLFIEEGIENKFNTPNFLFSPIANTGAYLYNRNLNHGEYMDLDGSVHYVTSNKRANSHKVTIGNDVKKGNTYTGSLSNGGRTFNVTYTANITDTANSVANQIKQQLLNQTGGNGGNIIRQIRGNQNSEIQPERNIYINTDDGLGNISFEFSIIDYTDNGYYGSTGSVNPVQFNSLKDTGQSVSNMKLGAGIKFGIMYEDFQGRRSLVYTDDTLIATTSTQNALGGMKAPIFSLTLNHTPPVWAKFYQIVRTKDLTYADFIQMIIQKVIDVEATNTGGDYLDLVVGSLYTYQKIHPNTTLQYTFKKGDRIRLISKDDGTYYPDFETEILSYKDTTVEQIKTNLTVNGTDTVTVASATDDNIGRFILVDGNEREIIGRPSNTTYTVNAPIGKASQDPYLSYELVDRRGLLRIRKPSANIEITDQSLVEIFSPSLSVDTLGQKQFFHFNKKFPILNAGKPNRYHDANGQAQSATQPAIVRITEGTVFVRNREMPLTNTIPNAQVVVRVIEDESYSDFYYSNLNDNGRDNVEDNKQGVVHFGSRIRFSSIALENTAINGLNDFANLDREDYNDKYGDFKLTIFTENQILGFKELKDTNIPVYQTIIEDNSGQQILGASKKLLNDIRYYSHDGGIGNNPESYCRNEGRHYHVSANSGCYVRLSTDGVTPLSQIYFFDNEARLLLSNASLQNANIYGEYDRLLGCVVWYIEGYNEKTFSQGFTGAVWEVLSDAIENPVQAIVTQPSNGVLSVDENGLPVYTPNTDFVGNDSFTYSTVGGVVRKVCITVDDVPNRQTGWRQKASSAYCITGEGVSTNTGMQGWTISEQYYLDNGANTGLEKDNLLGDPDYVSPIQNETACPIGLTLRTAHNLGSNPHSTEQTVINVNAVEVYRGSGTFSSTTVAEAGDTVLFDFNSTPFSLPWSPDSGLNFNIKANGLTVYNEDITVQSANLGSFEYVVPLNTYDLSLTVTPLVTVSEWKIRELKVVNSGNIGLINFKSHQNPAYRLIANLDIINGTYFVYYNLQDTPDSMLITLNNDNTFDVRMVITKTSDSSILYDHVFTPSETVTDIDLLVNNITLTLTNWP